MSRHRYLRSILTGRSLSAGRSITSTSALPEDGRHLDARLGREWKRSALITSKGAPSLGNLSFTRQRRFGAPSHEQCADCETDRIVPASIRARADEPNQSADNSKRGVHQYNRHYA